MATEKIVVMQDDAIPLGSTVVYDRGKDTLMVLTKIADDGFEGEWTSVSGDKFEMSDRKIREFKCFKDLKLYMSKSQEIVDLLNELISLDPNVARLLDSGVPANDAIDSHPTVQLRSTVEGKYITTTGIISAIGRLLGEEIHSVYDDNDSLVKFEVARS